MLRLLPSPPHRLRQIALRKLLPRRKVPSCDLRVDLHPRVRGDQVLCNPSPVSLAMREGGKGKEKEGKGNIPGISYRLRIGIPLFTIASYFLQHNPNTISLFLQFFTRFPPHNKEKT